MVKLKKTLSPPRGHIFRKVLRCNITDYPYSPSPVAKPAPEVVHVEVQHQDGDIDSSPSGFRKKKIQGWRETNASTSFGTQRGWKTRNETLCETCKATRTCVERNSWSGVRQFFRLSFLSYTMLLILHTSIAHTHTTRHVVPKSVVE